MCVLKFFQRMQESTISSKLPPNGCEIFMRSLFSMIHRETANIIIILLFRILVGPAPESWTSEY